MENINKFKYFEKKTELEEKLTSAKDEYDKYTSFVADTLEVYTHGKWYKCDVNKSYVDGQINLLNSSINSKYETLKNGGNAEDIIEAGYNYSGCNSNITSVTGFDWNNQDAVVVTTQKILSFPQNVRVMAGIYNIGNFDYYVYCFSYIGGEIYVNAAGYNTQGS